ncbi:MAG: phenylacetic acid degradation operon negative regulatory protein PaaX [Rhodoferax sp.]|nr:phenylacetic acid degradation operon negative regulatory protein PaaX [Rhodoferax sp.]
MRQAHADPVSSPTVDVLRRALHIKGSSLVMTLFGDAIAMRAQPIWLSSLIRLASPFGLSSRLVRTSVYRLVADDWLLAAREGRRSHYRLTPNGALRVRHAQRRIYGDDVRADTAPGSTLLMISADLKASARQQLQRELVWNGYGELADGVYAHTRADRSCLQDILRSNRACDHVCVMQADLDSTLSKRPLHTLRASRCCPGRLEQAWRRFIERFSPLQNACSTLTDHEAFLVRILLVHEFRRILQRQPTLTPDQHRDEALTHQARRLFEELYQHLLQPSERYLDHELASCPALTPARTSAPWSTDKRSRAPALGQSSLH